MGPDNGITINRRYVWRTVARPGNDYRLAADGYPMVSSDGLPMGWEVWNEEDNGPVILAFRPDVFDGTSFDAACLPTISVARGASPDHPPRRRARSDSWHVALYLEPTVRARSQDRVYDSREAALAGANEVARRFASGEIDYRGVYQVPRDAYFEALDGLVGAGDNA